MCPFSAFQYCNPLLVSWRPPVLYEDFFCFDARPLPSIHPKLQTFILSPQTDRQRGDGIYNKRCAEDNTLLARLYKARFPRLPAWLTLKLLLLPRMEGRKEGRKGRKECGIYCLRRRRPRPTFDRQGRSDGRKISSESQTL